jgi:hypothetical protein
MHNTIYDAWPSPDGRSVYGVTWSYDNRIFRYDPYEGREGRIYDLGRAYGPDIVDWSSFDAAHHSGGIILGDDGYLYYATSVCWKEPQGMYLIRMNVETLESEELGPLAADGYHSQYISKATRDFAGNLYFADSMSRPPRIYVYKPDYVGSAHAKPKWPLVRFWG